MNSDKSLTLRNVVQQCSNISNIFKYIEKEYRTLSDALNDVQLSNRFIKTHGYYNFRDGGGGIYYVTPYDPGDGNPLYIRYNDTHNLLYIPDDNKVNIQCLGCKNDGSTDCSEILNKLFKTLSSTTYTIYIPTGIFLCESPLIMEKSYNILGESSTRGTYIFEWNNDIYPKRNTSMLYFPFVEDSTAFTINIPQNGSVNISNVSFVSNTTEWKDEGFKYRPEIPYNPFSLTKRVENVNGVIVSSYNASFENCSFIGFSGYGLRTKSHNVHNCYVARCGSGIVNSGSDIMIQHSYITQCINGINAGSHGVIFIHDSFIDQCVHHGIYSGDNIEQTTLFISGTTIDHIGYSGINVNSGLDCKIDARMGRCGMYYAGKEDLSDLSDEEIYKAVTINYGTLLHGNLNLDIYKRSITDDSTDTEYLLPYTIFAGKYYKMTITGLYKSEYIIFHNEDNVHESTLYSNDGITIYK